MRILLIHNFYRNRGGECHAVYAQQHLLEQNGHQVIPFSADSSDLMRASFGQNLLAATGVRGNNRISRDLQKLIQIEKPDLAHVHNVFPILSPKIYPILKQLGVPIVQTIHNLRMICPGGLMYTDGSVCDECQVRGLHRAVVRRCIQGKYIPSLLYANAIQHAWNRGWIPNAIDRYLVLNRFFGNKLAAAGIPRERQRLLPNFVEVSHEAPAKKKPYVLFLGRLSAEKEIQTLLEPGQTSKASHWKSPVPVSWSSWSKRGKQGISEARSNFSAMSKPHKRAPCYAKPWLPYYPPPAMKTAPSRYWTPWLQARLHSSLQWEGFPT